MKELLFLHIVCLTGSCADTLSVCEALQRRTELNGKMVAIRGSVEGGHGAWLDGSDCAFKENDWKALIAVMDPHPSNALSSVDFKQDADAFRRVDSWVSRVKQPLKTRLYVTYVGRLETYPDLVKRTFVRPDGTTFRLGFGHLGTAPVQLLVQSVRDPAYEK